jgi:hypothetical protein
MKETAVDHFNSRRGNCAQAVALAWKEKKDPSSAHSEQFAAYGGGRAPQGFCGALHAARELAGEHQEKLTEQFKERTSGYTTCRDIRKNRVMPCTACVETAAEILEEVTR